MNPKVNFYFEKESRFQIKMQELRNIALETGLNEELKWVHPCYILDGKNIFLIHSFKEYCAILFFKGALMKDREKKLFQQTLNTQASMQLIFTNLNQIKNLEK